MYWHTHTRTGIIALVNYSAIARSIEVSESHSAIAESQTSNSSVEKEAFAYMTSTLEEMARRFEQQVQPHRKQLDMIRAQQESIDSLKQILSQLLEDIKKKPEDYFQEVQKQTEEGEKLIFCTY